jgi:uncharacterized membrane protein YagU involved in acid resistance
MPALISRSDRGPSDPFKGAVAGLVAGLAASWVMSRFQYAVPSRVFARMLGDDDQPGPGDDELRSSGGNGQEPATVQAAEAVSERLLDHHLTEDEKKWAGPAAHYVLGAVGGAAYGALAEARPGITAGAGLPYGTAFWLAADETAVPALGLSGPPWEYPPHVHAYGLASHLVYGITLEVLRKLLRRRL